MLGLRRIHKVFWKSLPGTVGYNSISYFMPIVVDVDFVYGRRLRLFLRWGCHVMIFTDASLGRRQGGTGSVC